MGSEAGSADKQPRVSAWLFKPILCGYYGIYDSVFPYVEFFVGSHLAIFSNFGKTANK